MAMRTRLAIKQEATAPYRSDVVSSHKEGCPQCDARLTPIDRRAGFCTQCGIGLRYIKVVSITENLTRILSMQEWIARKKHV